MHIINNVSTSRFTFNNVEYVKNYLSSVSGNRVEIFNCYERADQLMELTHYSEVSLNGIVYGSATDLQAALLNIIYSRNTLGSGADFNQNNKSKIFQIFLNGTGMATNTEVRNYINSTSGLNGTFNISETDTPVIVEAYKNNTEGTIKWSFLYGGGKGVWSAINQVASNQLRNIGFINAAPVDIENLPNTQIIPLGALPDGNYIAAANSEARDLSDPELVYLFSYIDDGAFYFVQFVGTPPGIYGGAGNPQFTDANLLPSTNENVQPSPIPSLAQVLQSGYQAINKEIGLFSGVGTDNWKYQEFFGGGLYHETGAGDVMIVYEQPTGWNITYTIPYRAANDIFAFLGDVNGLSLQINQNTSDLSLVNSQGNTLATINIGYLSGISNTLAYNANTQSIDVTDPEGNILTSIPLSSFVTNVAASASFNGATPHLLEFKDSNNAVVYSVPVTADNIQGLNTAITTVLNNALIDATTAVKGVVKLAGDFGGTADEPKVKKLMEIADPEATTPIAAMIAPDGTLQGQNTFEFEVYDEDPAGYATLAAINAAYPSIVGGELKRPQGFTVYCYFMANPTIYKKCGDSDNYWLKINNNGVSKLL